MLTKLKEELESEDPYISSDQKQKEPCGFIKFNFGGATPPMFSWQMASDQDLVSNFDFNKDKEYFSRLRINSNMPSHQSQSQIEEDNNNLDMDVVELQALFGIEFDIEDLR